MDSLVPYAFVVFILIWITLIIVDSKSDANLEKRLQTESKINSIKVKINEIEKKIAYVEDAHGYTSVTTLLRYEIDQLEKELEYFRSILLTLK